MTNQREIKFRVWDTVANEWLSDIASKICLYISPEKSGNVVCFPSYWTLQQFTGLTDKNDKDIYEGDIVQWDERVKEFSNIGQVIWDKSGCGFVVLSTDAVNYAVSFISNLKIVGNIYENPELIKS